MLTRPCQQGSRDQSQGGRVMRLIGDRIELDLLLEFDEFNSPLPYLLALEVLHSDAVGVGESDKHPQ
ncbi:hypothetical protein N7539_008254 [Penicillium diatomitis]|uniref:Uncharacterized protein n=1 Tax=Penicillium diatomitis TaxID=2819901 RepID=A0A9W9WTI1_9EURO|nr:uncharacterized protein N7539_008254 [Penicillium diatomitis]KAJ5475188.1 hypothetical protein N7539_008254 [Penicillium diatomitis]